MKKFILIALLMSLPVIADEINMTPSNTFSGYNNKSFKTQFPQVKKSVSASDIIEDREEFMKPKSIRQMGDITPNANSPMTYDRFPQNYDSSNMMLMQGARSGLQNMFMGGY